MRRQDRLKALIESRKRQEVVIVQFPTWMISDQALTRVADGTVQRVQVSVLDVAVTVWVARVGNRYLAAAPVGPATPDEIAIWCKAQMARQPKTPPARDLVADVFKP